MTTDGQLLRRYAENADEAAFAELVGRYVDLAYSAALRLLDGDRPAAQDAVQSVFTDMARKARALCRHETLVGWLHTSVRYAALAARRSQKRRHMREQEVSTMQIPSSDSEPDWSHLQPLLDEAVGALRDGDRQAVLLRFFQNKSYPEIGGLIGLDEEAARKRVERAVEKLRAYFSRRGVAVSSGALVAAVSANSVQAAPAGFAASVPSASLAGAAAVPVTASIFLMTTQTKIILAVVLACAAVPAIYYSTRPEPAIGAESAGDNFYRFYDRNASNSTPAVAAAQNRTSASEAAFPASGAQTTVAQGADSTFSASTPGTAPGAAVLASVKAGLLEFKTARDLDKIDAAAIEQVRVWARQDPEAVVSWLSDIREENKAHEHALEGMIAITSKTDPKVAVEMANAITDPQVRDSRLEDAFTVLALADPATAAVELKSAKLSDEKRTSLARTVELLHSGKITDEQRAKLVERVQKMDR